MKIISIIITFIVLNISQLQAQSFESFYKKGIEDFKTNPKSYIQKTCTSDFIFIKGHNGNFINFDQMVALFSEDKSIPKYQVDIKKMVESGDMAVVSGISINPQPNMIYKDAFTYTYRKIQGEWKWEMAHHTKIDYKAVGASDK